MASSIASDAFLGDIGTQQRIRPKQNAVEKIGGIICHICNLICGNKKDFDTHYTTIHDTELQKGSCILYTCVLCKKQMSDYPRFRDHCYTSHLVKNKFQCNQCDKSFNRLCVLNAHISAVHDYLCSTCGDKFSSKNEWQVHTNMHSIKHFKNKPPYPCITCSVEITSLDECESHIDDHSTVQYPCPICKEVLPDKCTATKHLKKHFDEDIPTDGAVTTPGEDSSVDMLGGIRCCHCEQVFKNRIEIDSHFETDHSNKTIVYTCNICDKQYEKYMQFGNHCHYHISKDKYHCVECNREFPRLSLLVIHTEAYHGDCSKNPLTCDLCSHSFMTHYRLREHKRLVHEESNIRCSKPDCTATFKNSRDLIMHQRFHKCVENWCRACGLTFPSAAAATRHLDAHRRPRHACPVCGNAYRDRCWALKHLPVHFASVLHICKLCNKSFKRPSRLAEHLKTHAATKAYRCPHCSRTFQKPYQLRQHINVHTSRRPFACPRCPRAFNSDPNWRKHLAHIHDVDETTIRELSAAHKAAQLAQVSEQAERVEATPVTVTDPAESEDEPEDSFPAEAQEMRIRDPVTGARMTLAETVSAAIDRIDSIEDLDPIDSLARIDSLDDLGRIEPLDDLDFVDDSKPVKSPLHSKELLSSVEPSLATDVLSGPIRFPLSTEIILEKTEDDSSDIQAIVEHIESMSEEMQLAAPAAGPLHFAEMMPVDSDPGFNTVSDNNMQEPYTQLEQYTLASPSEDVTSQLYADDQFMPHIDPMLTVKAEENKMYVQHTKYAPTFDPPAWEPLITKVYGNAEATDVNMFIY